MQDLRSKWKYQEGGGPNLVIPVRTGMCELCLPKDLLVGWWTENGEVDLSAKNSIVGG